MAPAPWTAYQCNVVGPDAEVVARCNDRRTAWAVAAIHELLEAVQAAEGVVQDPSVLLLLRTAAAKAKGL